jgi:TonB-linked SusC/RagA family outer membrane protein
MKYIKIVFFICAIHTLFSLKMSAQDKKVSISAIVVDSKGNQVPGVTIISDKTQTAVTNDSGEFDLTVSANSLLTIKATGYKAKTVEAKSDLKSIVLEPSEMVNVAFNTVDKADILGGVSSVNIAKMLGSNYTTFSLDNLASYIPGYHGNIWGMNGRITIVDGIPRDEYNVVPSEIEDITVLKSAAAVALYGSLGAKGVVSITTKRGSVKKNRFDVRVNTGIAVPKRYADYLGSAEYLTLYNEALSNDKFPSTDAAYTSDAVIANYASGTNPYRYPNVDFYSSDNLKKYSKRSEVVTEYTGGNDITKFYVNVGNYNTTTLLDIGNGKKEGENRFNIRGNLDIKLSKMITSKINTSVTFYDNNQAQGNFWSNAATFKPNLVSPLIPVSYLRNTDAASLALIATDPFIIDGKYFLGGTNVQATNSFADIYTKGIIKGTTRKYQFDASLNFDLANVLKGLTFDTQFGIDYNTSYSQNIDNNTYAVYYAGTPTNPTSGWATDADGDYISTLTRVGANTNNNYRTLDNSYQRQTEFFSGAFKYKFNFDKVHNFSTLLLAHGYRLAESQVYHAVANANLGFQFNYNYKNKYYVDFTENMVHSAKFAPRQRDAFSPTVSVGWRISNEKFLSESKFINDLKLTGSAAILNSDYDHNNLSNMGYNLYRTSYSSDNGAFFSWQEGRQLRATDVVRGANADLGFEQRKEYSLGLEASLFKNMVQVNASYFISKLVNIPTQNFNGYPSFLTESSVKTFAPYTNYLADQRKGFDLGITINKKIQKVELNVGMVATYYDTKAAVRNDVAILDSYQYLQGKPMDAIFGFKSEGFFSVADIAAMDNKDPGAHASQSALGSVKPGSLKYVDVNKDGIVDNKDQVYLGKGGYYGSPLTVALNITAKWNNFSLFILANRTSGSIGMKSSSYYWASGINAKYTDAMRGRWTEATAETATYPSLSTGNNGANNFRNSDFWMYKNDRISLSRVQLSYDIPKTLLTKTFMSNLGLYVNGNDLFLIAKEKKLMETNIGSSPQVRYYSVGLTAAF